jgi:hypothetical protein
MNNYTQEPFAKSIVSSLFHSIFPKCVRLNYEKEYMCLAVGLMLKQDI